MFEPKYLIRISETEFPCDEVVCLGTQLKAIIENLRELLEPHAWFCANVDAFSSMPKKLGIDSFQAKKIGEDSDVIALCESINQFLSGVFIAIKKEAYDQNISDLKIKTEDKEFRDLNLNGVLIEIRTFDTSYFELYSEDEELIKALSSRYKKKDIIRRYL